jgi:thymidine phosphorylase
MNEVLGTTAGNAVEIEESMKYLRNERREARLDEVVLELCAEMLLLGGIETAREAARARADRAVTSGAAAQTFGRMTSALGGPRNFVEDYRNYLPQAAVSLPVLAGRDGYLAEVDAFAVGNAIIALGGGRRKLDDKLDLSVGLTDVLPIGSKLGQDTPLAMVHAATAEAAQHAAQLLRTACRIDAEKPPERPVIHQTLV